jgi:Leucine-rich repeat (LRR) protein
MASLPELTCSDVLYIHDNQLTSVPPLSGSMTLIGLTSLRKLDLRWNKLHHAPRALRSLQERGCVVML